MQNTISDPQWNKKNWIPQLNPWHFLLGLSTCWDMGQIWNLHLWGLRLVVPERGSDIVRSLKTNRSPNMGSEIFSGPFFWGSILNLPELDITCQHHDNPVPHDPRPLFGIPRGGLGSWSKSYGFTGSTQFQTLGFWGLLWKTNPPLAVVGGMTLLHT